MEIRFDLCFLLFIILNVSDLNAIGRQQKSVGQVCGKPAQTVGFIVHGKDFKRGEFPWMVAMLYKRNITAEFFGAATLISTRHLITGT